MITPQHALEMHSLMQGSRLAIIPGAHGEYIGEITTLKPGFTEASFVTPMIVQFLDGQEN